MNRVFPSIYPLQGFIQDAYIVSGPNGYLKQCPNMKTQCPTCGQFSLLEKTIDDLIKNLDELKQRVSTNLADLDVLYFHFISISLLFI